MYSKPWVILTAVLCAVFAVLAFPIFLRAEGLSIAIAYTLIGFAVIWLAYFVRAWVFTRPGFWDDKRDGGEPD